MTGRHLCLLHQIDYTDGHCDLFAAVLTEIVEGTRVILVSDDPVVTEAHDWPTGMELDLHVCIQDPSGDIIDAEGRRPLAEMLEAFGVPLDGSWWLIEDPDGLEAMTRFGRAPRRRNLDGIRDILAEAGWDMGIPRANRELSENIREARALQDRRFRRSSDLCPDF